MARLFTSGFETQSATTGVEFTTGGLNGTSAIDTSNQRSGAACMKFVTSASFSWMRETFKSSLSNSEAFVRVYVKFFSLPGSGTHEILTVADMGGAVARAQVRYNGATGNLEIVNVGNTVIGTVAVTTGAYYRLEVDVAGGSGTGIIKAYLDGSQFATSTTETLGTFDGIYLGSAFNATTISFYMDDIAINDTSGSAQTGLPGDGKVITLKPSAAGDVNTFATQTGGTAGAGNNFTRVDEITPNDATDFNGSSTLNQEDLFNMDNSGLSAGDTITVVQVNARTRNSTADASAAFKTEIEKAAAGTIAQSASTVPNSTTWKTNNSTTTLLPLQTLYTDPDGGAWSQTTLDSMQVGYKLTTAPGTGGRRVEFTKVWVNVDYASGTTTTKTETGTARITATTTKTETGTARITATTTKTATGVSNIVALAATLIDNFDDNNLDLTKWQKSGGDTARIAEQNQRLEITHTNTIQYNFLQTPINYDFVSSSAYVQIVDAGNQALVSHETGILMSKDATNKAWVFIGNGRIAAYKLVANVQTQIGADLTYNSSVHKYLRIRESAGTWYFDYSTDAVSWTNQWTLVNPFGTTRGQIWLYSSCWQNEATGSYGYFDNFNVAVTTTTKTETGTARITATTTKTETGTARIQKSATQTETGIARIRKSVSQTETGVSRITATTTKTETGVAKITATTTKTETGVSRIQKSATQTETGISRVTKTVSQTETGTARITATTTKTESGTARVTATTTKTETGVSRITRTVTQTETGTARITATTQKTESGIAKITATTTKTETGIAAVLRTTTKTETGVAAIVNTTLRTETGTARITATTLKTESGTARIQKTASQTETGIARIRRTVTQTETGISRITATTQRTETGTARITKTVQRTETGTARVTQTVQKTETGISRIGLITQKTETGVSRVQKAVNQTETGIARITATVTRTESGVARIRQTVQQTESGTARIRQTVSRTETGIARIEKSATKTETGIARIANVVSQTETGTARIDATTQQTITGTAYILGESTTLRTMTGTARIVKDTRHHGKESAVLTTKLVGVPTMTTDASHATLTTTQEKPNLTSTQKKSVLITKNGKIKL